MDFRAVEKKWQEKWGARPDLYKSKNKGEKKYILVEFPYPSGSGLHIGHAFSYTGGDVYARFKRMQGFDVLFPMGWDAFGLPTENHAIKTKQKPQTVTKNNTDAYREEMKRLAFSFDWAREINTTDPNYYKWTQWIFIQLFKKGLAYKKEMPINWCPSCKIGLANEEVVDGKCERCGAEVSRRNISQWVVKITDYADRLIEGLKETDFVEKVKMAQVNWIGKSEGAKINFKVQTPLNLPLTGETLTKQRPALSREGVGKGLELEVFTTRPDTLYGATFMVISPEHELAIKLAENNEEIRKYQLEARRKSDLERTELNKNKTGVFSGLYAINPVNNKEIPIWISDFVLASYGTGAIMAVPAHDERDFEFAKKFGLGVIEVVGKDGKLKNSGDLNGLTVEEASEKLIGMRIGEKESSYHLRDWIFSRQHYWGEPIPMVNCPKCNWVPEKEENLPVVLPEVEAYEPTDTGESPLAKMTDWVKCKCPVCGGEAKRETDTMPNWAGSDWYYLRYIDPNNNSKLADFDLLKRWLPVDVYAGGDEHNTLHLLYSRFIHQFLNDLGVVPTREPYYRRLSHGVILGPDGARMSKSRGNVVVPGEIVAKFGVDVMRMYLMFMGPFEATMVWDEKTLMGVKRFLDRFEKTITNYQLRITNDSDKNVRLIINKLIDGVTRDLENFSFNTVIAKLMKALNQLSINNYELRIEEIKTLIKLIAPMAPYMAEELWSKLGEGSVHEAGWPIAEEKYLTEEEIMIPVAVDGKMRDQLSIMNDQLRIKNKILARARELPKVKKWIEGKEVVKEIYVVGKMVNFVLK